MQELDLEGSNEETGRQLCGLMTTLADFHWAHVDSMQKQHSILKYVSEPEGFGGTGLMLRDICDLSICQGLKL